MRLAAIDVGSNAIRFVAAEFLTPNQYIVLESERAPIRLGSGTFQDGRLAPEVMQAALRAMAHYQERLRVLQIEQVRAIATSAVRESRNGDAFVQKVKARTGVPLEIIGGAEETQLVFRAVQPRIPLGRKPWLLANLGGGSLELALVNRQGVVVSETHTVGAVRLWDMFRSSAGTPRTFLRLMEEYTATLRPALGGMAGPWAGVMATGGNIEELAKLMGHPSGKNGMHTVTVRDLKQWSARLSRCTLSQRIHRWGIHPDRADVILPAAVVYAHLGLLSGQAVLHVPFVGTKEGILLDLADRLTLNSSYAENQEKQLWNLTVSLGRRYQFDEAHGVHVCRMALSLFEQLQTVHGLGPVDQRILLVASLLHDIGAFISYKKHHKHSGYLLAQSELPGLSPLDMQLTAQVARYHRKSVPTLAHEPYARLSRANRTRVDRLSALLRIADALDRDHAQRIRRIHVRLRKGQMDLAIAGSGANELDHWALQRKAEWFGKVFKRRVRRVTT